jgi:hypothetical protein
MLTGNLCCKAVSVPYDCVIGRWMNVCKVGSRAADCSSSGQSSTPSCHGPVVHAETLSSGNVAGPNSTSLSGSYHPATLAQPSEQLRIAPGCCTLHGQAVGTSQLDTPSSLSIGLGDQSRCGPHPGPHSSASDLGHWHDIESGSDSELGLGFPTEGTHLPVGRSARLNKVPEEHWQCDNRKVIPAA